MRELAQAAHTTPAHAAKGLSEWLHAEDRQDGARSPISTQYACLVLLDPICSLPRDPRDSAKRASWGTGFPWVQPGDSTRGTLEAEKGGSDRL